ncbi:DUF2970 domain-containing protein [Thalassotalea maritima]|uniref:DUF2970 domain-containing protein n=1 Tax=Thalassotalea maritima TaxID=3242416 RepID=UPI0035299272
MPANAKNTLTLKQLLASILAALIGVQSDAYRQRDFRQGKLSHFIIAGIIAVTVFVLALVFVVNVVLRVSQ